MVHQAMAALIPLDAKENKELPEFPASLAVLANLDCLA
jgi:hypothetical protein